MPSNRRASGHSPRPPLPPLYRLLQGWAGVRALRSGRHTLSRAGQPPTPASPRAREREFTFAPSCCREITVPVAAPLILPAEWRGRPVYRKGLVVGAWRCILAFDSVAGVKPPPTAPSVLSPFRNPMFVCVPSLYNDLRMVFQFYRFQKIFEKGSGLSTIEEDKLTDSLPSLATLLEQGTLGGGRKNEVFTAGIQMHHTRAPRAVADDGEKKQARESITPPPG